MISRELFSIRVETNLQTMEMTSWWRNLLSFFLVLAILRETSMEMDVNENFQCHFEKKQTNTQVNSNFPWSVLLSTIEMTSKCLKLCCGTTSRHNIALAILRETSTEIDVKTFNDIVTKTKQTNKQINSNFPWSVLLSTTEMTSKCSKLCGGTTSRHIIWESYLSLLSCVARLCFGGQSRLMPGQPFLTKENNKAREWRYLLWPRLER